MVLVVLLFICVLATNLSALKWSTPQHLGTISALEEERLQRCRTIDIALLLLMLRTGAADIVLNDQRRAFSDEYVNLLLATCRSCIEVSAHSPLAQMERIAAGAPSKNLIAKGQKYGPIQMLVNAAGCPPARCPSR